jgi:hypothetical protein
MAKDGKGWQLFIFAFTLKALHLCFVPSKNGAKGQDWLLDQAEFWVVHVYSMFLICQKNQTLEDPRTC